MLTIPEYKEKYPDEKYVGSFQEHPIYPGMKFLAEGMLLFTEETASSWGGPYQGGYAHFLVTDYTNAVFAYGKDKGKKVLEAWHQSDLEVQAKIDRGHYQYGTRYKSIYPYFHSQENPSLEKPIRLWIMGNDDTSYSKFYATEQEALDELSLFIGNEPLDYLDVIIGFRFIFTN